MKRILVIVFMVCSIKASSQSFEIEQLILDWQKLSELKNILSDLYKGYKIVSDGYEAIKNIAQGNFNLHKAFLDGLLLVNPAVKNYKRVEDIIDYQARIVSEYKAAYNHFKNNNHFSADEIVYLGQVYGNLFNESLNDIDHLINIITASKLRMSDDERLHAIDNICDDSRNKLLFLRSFNNSTAVLAAQRNSETSDIQTLKNLY